jgi:site-specific DNA-methyltransferase (adenine-specific)
MKAQESGNKVYGQAGRKEDGRFPANVIHDGSDEVLSNFPETTKAGNSKDMNKNLNYDATSYKLSNNKNPKIEGDIGGSASRFFYCAKASQKDRNEGCEKLEGKYVAQGNQAQAELKRGNLDFQKGNMHNKIELKQNFHPTVKPTDLMRYLCRLVTPKNGIVLDPYMGSGSTGKAAILEGFSFIGMELDEEYFNIAKARIENAEKIYIDSQKQLKAL